MPLDTRRISELPRSERGGGEQGFQLGPGGLGRFAQPGMGGVREEGEEFLVSPVSGGGEGGVSERIGHAPTHLDEVVKAALIDHGFVVVGSDGGGELVGEMPVQGEVGAGGAVVDFEEIALGLEGGAANIVRNMR